MIDVLEVKVYEHFLSPALFVKFYSGVCHSQKKLPWLVLVYRLEEMDD
jgi:hypothetical protein